MSCGTSVCSRLRCTMKMSNKTRLFCGQEQLRTPLKISLVVIEQRCRRRRFRWNLPPVTNRQEIVACSPRISPIRNSSTIQSIISSSCGWVLRESLGKSALLLLLCNAHYNCVTCAVFVEEYLLYRNVNITKVCLKELVPEQFNAIFENTSAYTKVLCQSALKNFVVVL